MNEIQRILHDIFREDAIYAAAYGEQIEDIKYCIDHHMNHLKGGDEKKRWEEHLKKAKVYSFKDEKNKNTYNDYNMKKFRIRVDKYLKLNPKARLYDDLNEIEHFAVRCFYYSDSY